TAPGGDATPGTGGVEVLTPHGRAAVTPRDVLTRYVLLAIAAGLFLYGFLATVSRGPLHWGGPIVAGIVLVFAAGGAIRALADIAAPRTVEGTVIRKILRHYDPYGPDEITTTLGGTHQELPPVSWIAISDGRSRRVRGVRLHPDIADHLA